MLSKFTDEEAFYLFFAADFRWSSSEMMLRL